MDTQTFLAAPQDVLARRVLARPGDPTYDQVAGLLPQNGSWDFVGTPRSQWKPLVHPDGRITIRTTVKPEGGKTDFRRDVCCLFDPAHENLPYAGQRGSQELLDGYLPVSRTRIAMPDGQGEWEQTSLVSTDAAGSSTLLIHAARFGENASSAYFAVAEPACPDLASLLRMSGPAPANRIDGNVFDQALAALRRDYRQVLAGCMTLETPGKFLANAALGGLVKSINTYVGTVPHYGATRYFCDDGRATESFPPTTTTMADACLEWGLFDRARACLDHHLRNFVSAEGALQHRGTGASVSEHGMMLSSIARYAAFTGDTATVEDWGDIITAICQHLLNARGASDGLIHGCPEDDVRSWPARPWFSGNCWACRGLMDIAPVLLASLDSSQRDLGRRLQNECRAFRKTIVTAVESSIIGTTTPPFIPPWPGYTEPIANFTDPVCFPGCPSDWMFLSGYSNYRFYPEMLSARILPRRQADLVLRYREQHGGELLGLTRLAFGRNVLVDDWPVYNVLRGLLDLDKPRKFLLTVYSHLAHHQARGTFFAPESTSLDKLDCIHCVPSQLTVPLAAKWMLVDAAPGTDTLWLNRAAPRPWLEPGQRIAVSEAPTPWGRVSYQVESELDHDRIKVQVTLPAARQPRHVMLRLRCPRGWRPLRAESATGETLPVRGGETFMLTPNGATEFALTVRCTRQSA
ncbi:MAG: hypothetical protein A3K19_19050 [Lentisphaerae bacterium RIFOXYB12_FULL_65_16]|nr:MAG: hypothetical protein A3K18_29340 [Lentisphaerae bacterium RIFOXYA12_64_32]OGV86871.1 MAG: hypothetical protein A3K19_19050 [Lentisphaerae bacterium RIFOXYB12_FULL_65_16]